MIFHIRKKSSLIRTKTIFLIKIGMTACCIALLGSCQSLSNAMHRKTSESNQAHKKLFTTTYSKSLFKIIKLELEAKNEGQINQIISEYLELVERTKDPQLAERATDLAIKKNNLPEALKAARVWAQISPTSGEIPLLSILDNIGEYKEFESVLKSMLERARSSDELHQTYEKIRILLASRKLAPTKKLAMMLRLSLPDRLFFYAHQLVSELAKAAGNFDLALSESIKSLHLSPDNDFILLNLANIASQIPDKGPGQGIPIVQEFATQHPQSTLAKISLAALYFSDQQKARSLALLKSTFPHDTDSLNTFHLFAELALYAKKFDIAEQALKKCLSKFESNKKPQDSSAELNPSNDTAIADTKFLLAKLAEKREQPKRAIPLYIQAIQGNNAIAATQRAAILIAKTRSIEESFFFIQRQQNILNNKILLSIMQANVLRENDRMQEALSILEQLQDSDTKIPDVLLLHAKLSEETGDLRQAQKKLRTLVALEPFYAQGYNALGYLLANNNIKLQESKILIERAFELEPSSAEVLDSMGWVLFRMNQPQKALPYLVQAFAIVKDPEIGVHLGEVLWNLGEKDRAISIFKIVFEEDPNSELLKKTMSRLKITHFVSPKESK